jgi:hypothetical protein
MARAQLSLLVFVAALVTGVPGAALAQADFYRGKQIRLISGHPVGGDYDLGARFLAKYLSRHIPGEPVVVVQNMPAAASVVAANFIYNQAPRDGTVIGSFSRNLAARPAWACPKIEVDPRRFNWLGGRPLPSRICVNWHTSPVKTVDDLFTREMITAGGGATVAQHHSDRAQPCSHQFALSRATRAFDARRRSRRRGRGVHAHAQFNDYQHLVRDGAAHPPARRGNTHPDIPQVPRSMGLPGARRTSALRFVFASGIGRPYVLPPEVSAERVASRGVDLAQDPQMRPTPRSPRSI